LKRISLFILIWILFSTFSVAIAWEKGENRIEDSSFEAAVVGEIPAEWNQWTIMKSG
jgi:hypothetical protein